MFVFFFFWVGRGGGVWAIESRGFLGHSNPLRAKDLPETLSPETMMVKEDFSAGIKNRPRVYGSNEA